MKQKIVVEEEKFKTLLSQLVETKPIPMKKSKTPGKRGPKSPVIPGRSES